MQKKNQALNKHRLFSKDKFREFNLLRNWYYFFSCVYLLLIIVLLIVGIISLVSPDFIIKDANEIYNWPLGQYKDTKERTLNDIINSVGIRSYNLYVYSVLSVFIPLFFIAYNFVFLISYLFIGNGIKKLGSYFFIKNPIINISIWTLFIIFIFSLIGAIWNIFSILYFQMDWMDSIESIKLLGISENYNIDFKKNIYSVAIFIFPTLIMLSLIVSLIIWNILDKQKNK